VRSYFLASRLFREWRRSVVEVLLPELESAFDTSSSSEAEEDSSSERSSTSTSSILVDVLPWGGLEARSAPLRMRLEEAAMRDVLVEPELR